MTELEGRDRSIVQLVARFKQLSSRQIHDVLFTDRSSRTPCDRALRRLTTQGFLHRIERRIVGGSRGGSGQYVYQLGRRGFYSHFTGRYSPARAINYHSLAIAECFIVMRKLEGQGKLRIVGLSTEPDCWREVGGVLLKPDMYVELVDRSANRTLMWMEIDMGTEAQRQLRGKMEAYWRAWQDADVSAVPVFPKTLWVAVDDERAKELEWIISSLHPEAQTLFSVTTGDNLAASLSL